VLARKDPGNFVVIDEPHLFNYPYASVLQNLHTLNSPNYYFGCNDDTALISSELIDVSRKADYLISMNEINSSDLRHIETVSLSNLLEHKSHAVFERKAEYLSHYETGWSDDLYLYETNCEGKGGCALKNISDNPLSFTLHTKGREGEILTSINYSPWLKVGDLSTHEDEFGFLSVTGPFVGKLEFTYINPYLYIGFAISLASLLFAIFTVKRS
jgi:uncharacterized membrane protein YfhO